MVVAQGSIKAEVSIVRDTEENEVRASKSLSLFCCFSDFLRQIRIYTDAGRICRPLFIVEPETGLLTIKKQHVRRLVKDRESYGWKGNCVCCCLFFLLL